MRTPESLPYDRDPGQARMTIFQIIQSTLQQKNILTYQFQGITTVTVPDSERGLDLAKSLLEKIVDKKTFLLLSGGRTPKELYTSLAKEEKIAPGAVGMIDERYGSKFHEYSNETMLKNTGLLRYFEMRNIPFYPISPVLPGSL